MIFQPVAGVTVDVSRTGRLELFLPMTGKRLRCDSVGSAMWIALRQHGGRIGDAAETLAGIWSVDPRDMRFAMVSWAGELCSAGMLRDDW